MDEMNDILWIAIEKETARNSYTIRNGKEIKYYCYAYICSV